MHKWLKSHPVPGEEDATIANVAHPTPARDVLVRDQHAFTDVRDPAPCPADQPAWRPAHPVAYLAVTALLALSVGLSAVIHPSENVYRAGVVVHLLGLVVGFGAVVLVDWHGVLWLRGRRNLAEASNLAEAANPLIWTAIVALLASGTVLKPNLGSEMTWVKIVAVLLICLNGVSLGALPHMLRALAPHTPHDLPKRPRRRMLTAAAISHLGWWTAIAIGLVTNLHRS